MKLSLNLLKSKIPKMDKKWWNARVPLSNTIYAVSSLCSCVSESVLFIYTVGAKYGVRHHFLIKRRKQRRFHLDFAISRLQTKPSRLPFSTFYSDFFIFFRLFRYVFTLFSIHQTEAFAIFSYFFRLFIFSDFISPSNFFPHRRLPLFKFFRRFFSYSSYSFFDTLHSGFTHSSVVCSFLCWCMFLRFGVLYTPSFMIFQFHFSFGSFSFCHKTVGTPVRPKSRTHRRIHWYATSARFSGVFCFRIETFFTTYVFEWSGDLRARAHDAIFCCIKVHFKCILERTKIQQ